MNLLALVALAADPLLNDSDRTDSGSRTLVGTLVILLVIALTLGIASLFNRSARA